MKSLKVPLGLRGIVAALAVTLVTLASHAGVAQTDSFTGTWVLNVARSKYTPAPPPRSQTVIYEAAGLGIKVSAKGTDAAGRPTTTLYTANYDGRDYPVTGNPDWDAIALKRIDAFTVELTRKRAGKVVQTGTNVVSKDGKTRTITTSGVNAQGQKINTIAVYERK